MCFGLSVIEEGFFLCSGLAVIEVGFSLCSDLTVIEGGCSFFFCFSSDRGRGLFVFWSSSN